MIQSYFKGKSSVDFYMDEDFKTSSSIGLLQYLPDDIFWEILRNSCNDLPSMDFGKIISFNFWEHTDPTGTTNTNFVEPDVWIETEGYDIIIEAKIGDASGQYPTQWENEILSIKNEQNNNDYEKPILLIAMGGNENMQPGIAAGCPVYKASWYNLLNAIVNERNTKDENGCVCRILDDVIEMFARQGVLKIEWMNTLPERQYTINKCALNIWENHKIGFYAIHNEIINEKIILQWQPISQWKNN
ncbi:MAG: hypothetical protein IKO89_06990 [Bacteroidales bacterium]|nr:hypothetical protein [Bacteroidales bacterium]